jgi:hypothetical protein
MYPLAESSRRERLSIASVSSLALPGLDPGMAGKALAPRTSRRPAVRGEGRFSEFGLDRLKNLVKVANAIALPHGNASAPMRSVGGSIYDRLYWKAALWALPRPDMPGLRPGIERIRLRCGPPAPRPDRGFLALGRHRASVGSLAPLAYGIHTIFPIGRTYVSTMCRPMSSIDPHRILLEPRPRG